MLSRSCWHRNCAFLQFSIRFLLSCGSRVVSSKSTSEPKVQHPDLSRLCWCLSLGNCTQSVARGGFSQPFQFWALALQDKSPRSCFCISGAGTRNVEYALPCGTLLHEFIPGLLGGAGFYIIRYWVATWNYQNVKHGKTYCKSLIGRSLTSLQVHNWIHMSLLEFPN